MKVRRKKRVAMISAAAIAVSMALIAPPSASGATVRSARASAFGVELKGLLPLEPQPVVTAKVPPGADDRQDNLLAVPAAPLATSFTAHVEAEANVQSKIEASLQQQISATAANAPTKYNARGYAVTEALDVLTGAGGDGLIPGLPGLPELPLPIKDKGGKSAKQGIVPGLVSAAVLEAEALAACSGGRTVFATGSNILDLEVGGVSLPVPSSPNQALVDAAGVRVVAWETNWDPSTLGTTDGSNTVYANALHVVLPAPLDIDLTVSHAEATGQCGPPVERKKKRRPRPPSPCPPALHATKPSTCVSNGDGATLRMYAVMIQKAIQLLT